MGMSQMASSARLNNVCLVFVYHIQTHLRAEVGGTNTQPTITKKVTYALEALQQVVYMYTAYDGVLLSYCLDEITLYMSSEGKH